MIDFSKFDKKLGNKLIDPRDIFMSLPSRNKIFEYPRDVQTEVWKQWFQNKDCRNNIIKMNTGSGKTVVGLIILKSCLNEGVGPAIYVVPDNYLVHQVRQQANELGIMTCDDTSDINYLMNKAILVINAQKLVNGRSAFGMRSFGNLEIGSIIIDDVHACMDIIKNQFSLTIFSAEHRELFTSLIEVFKKSLTSQSESTFSDIVDEQSPYQSMLVPFWEWQNKTREVDSLISSSNVEEFQFYFPLIRDCLPICNCMVSARSIEITPKSIPIQKISSFVKAKRRIFMSATLNDDSVFNSVLGLKRFEMNNIITPEKAMTLEIGLFCTPILWIGKSRMMTLKKS